jgi:hypothetical protein
MSVGTRGAKIGVDSGSGVGGRFVEGLGSSLIARRSPPEGSVCTGDSEYSLSGVSLGDPNPPSLFDLSFFSFDTVVFNIFGALGPLNFVFEYLFVSRSKPPINLLYAVSRSFTIT